MNIKKDRTGPTCFVMMPFTEQFEGYYSEIFSPAILKSKLTPIKINEIYTPTQVSLDIFSQIAKARLIIADVTGKNPNVNYELGIAHALGKDVIILTQSKNDVPFDYRHIRYIHYETHLAGWERRLTKLISESLRSCLSMNTPTTNIAGQDLGDLFRFLTSTALDSEYQISKHSFVTSDLLGNCHVEQSWTILAISDLTHFIHGVISDKPGDIHLIKAYDKSNGRDLKVFKPIAEERRVRYFVLLNKKLKAGQSLEITIEYTAQNYLAELFDKNRITIFQSPNSQNSVFYKSRTDVYNFPASSTTEGMRVDLKSLDTEGITDIVKIDDSIQISISINWKIPYNGIYSYDIILATDKGG